jgi:hypothetical protein
MHTAALSRRQPRSPGNEDAADVTIPLHLVSGGNFKCNHPCLFDYIRQNTNRTRQTAACKRALTLPLTHIIVIIHMD